MNKMMEKKGKEEEWQVAMGVVPVAKAGVMLVVAAAAVGALLLPPAQLQITPSTYLLMVM